MLTLTPLAKARRARALSLVQLSQMLNNTLGSSVSSLSRLEKNETNTVNKKTIFALEELFAEQGLLADHITHPDKYPDFECKDILLKEKNKNPNSDVIPHFYNEQRILVDITLYWFENSAMNTGSFAKRLYELLAADELVQPLKSADEYAKWVNTATRRVEKIIKGDQTFPLAWKYYWLTLLPENLKQQALAEMAANMGYMLVPLPVSTPTKKSGHESRASLHEISREFADVIQGSKPAHDGVYNDQDDPGELQLLQDELSDLIAVGLREQTVIENATGIRPKIAQIWSASPLNKPAKK